MGLDEICSDYMRYIDMRIDEIIRDSIKWDYLGLDFIKSIWDTMRWDYMGLGDICWVYVRHNDVRIDEVIMRLDEIQWHENRWYLIMMGLKEICWDYRPIRYNYMRFDEIKWD